MVLCHATAECAPVDASAHGAGGELPLPDARTLAFEPVGVGGARARVHCSERGERLLTAYARAVLATESGGDGRVYAAAATRSDGGGWVALARDGALALARAALGASPRLERVALRTLGGASVAIAV